MTILKIIWRWLRWPLYVVVAGFLTFVAYGFYLNYEKDITDRGIAKIDSHKLTLADVKGTNLPPVPDQAENDATVAGIDKNNNGIRDDVELAIFKKYPNDAKVRAAELQYAMALQTDITQVFNTETWLYAEHQNGRGILCLGETYPRTNLKVFSKITDGYQKEVENLVFNIESRQQARQNFIHLESNLPDNFSDTAPCDVALNTL